MIVYRRTTPRIIRDLRADPDVGGVRELRSGWVVEWCPVCPRDQRRRRSAHVARETLELQCRTDGCPADGGLPPTEWAELAGLAFDPTDLEVQDAADVLRAGWQRLTAEELEGEPPPQEYVLEPWIPAHAVSILAGPGGTAKTTLTVQLAVHRALGLPLFGMPVTVGETIILSTEDRIADYGRKLGAIRLELGGAFHAAAVAQRLHLLDLSGEPIRLVEVAYGQYHPTGLPDVLADVIRERAPLADLVVMETVSRLAGGAESNESLSILVEAAQRVVKCTGRVAVLLVAHVSQDAARRGVADAYTSRGGSALGDNARSTLVLTAVTAENAKVYAPGVDAAARKDLVVRVHVQSNGAPAAKPILLTRGGNQYGPILRVARAPGAPGPTEQLRVLQDLVARLRARGAEVSARKLREGYATELGVAKGRVERLVDDALAAGVLRRDGTVRGGGALLAAVEIETLKE